MVVQGILALALALPTGLLFGVGYGTGVRIGYEQVYPLLFPVDKDRRNVVPTVENIKRINGIYNAIGGKEASQMGIAMGLQGAMEEIDKNPDFQALEELELRLSGRTQSRLNTPAPLKETTISDFELGSSLDPNSPNFDPEYYIFVKKQQGDNEQTPTDKETQKLIDQKNFEERPKPPPIIDLNAQSKEWMAKRDKLINLYDLTKVGFIEATRLVSIQANSATGRYYKAIYNKQRNGQRGKANSASIQLRTMSQDYRHSNNLIRKQALVLKALISKGRFKRL